MFLVLIIVVSFLIIPLFSTYYNKIGAGFMTTGLLLAIYVLFVAISSVVALIIDIRVLV